MKAFCNYCFEYTPTVDLDCTKCGLSKSDGNMKEAQMKLEEKMAKYKTVNTRGRCPGCGNGWFFDIHGKYECTTCGRAEFASLEADRERDEAERKLRRQKENDEADARRRREQDDAASSAIGIGIGIAAESIIDSFSNNSSSDSGWSGGGGDFSGGGASGEW